VLVDKVLAVDRVVGKALAEDGVVDKARVVGKVLAEDRVVGKVLVVDGVVDSDQSWPIVEDEVVVPFFPPNILTLEMTCDLYIYNST
jgi:hypothetical protein